MKINWEAKEVIDILSNPRLSLNAMSKQLGVTIWHISRRRSRLGLGRLYSSYGHKSTNKERKQRYNSKIKLNNYKPLNSKL